MRYLLTLLVFLAMPSYAGLWELSLTNIAFLPDGRSGIEVARYVWDPAQIQICQAPPGQSCSDVIGFPPFTQISAAAYGPVSISYFGLVNGTGTGVIKEVFDCCEDYFYVGGSHTGTYDMSFGALRHPIEFTAVLDQALAVNGGFFGGEDGWSWHGGLDGIDRFMIESVRPLATPEPGTSVLVAVLFLMIAAVKIEPRSNNRARFIAYSAEVERRFRRC